MTADLSWRSPARQCEDGLFDHFDKIRYFLAGVEIYPFAGRVSIGHAPVSLALNPHQDQARLNQPAGLVIFRVELGIGFHWNNYTLARLPCPRQWQQTRKEYEESIGGFRGKRFAHG